MREANPRAYPALAISRDYMGMGPSNENVAEFLRRRLLISGELHPRSYGRIGEVSSRRCDHRLCFVNRESMIPFPTQGGTCRPRRRAPDCSNSGFPEEASKSDLNLPTHRTRGRRSATTRLLYPCRQICKRGEGLLGNRHILARELYLGAARTLAHRS